MHIKTWLFTVARNRSLDFLRHKCRLSQHMLSFYDVEARNEEDEMTFLDVIPDTRPTPEELAELHDLQREVQRAIGALPHTYRSVVWFSYGCQLNYTEIGRILDMPGSIVKTQFNRAKPFPRAVLMSQ
jgi:RNA polymerase sigma factor (sigma-70 family)